MLLLFYFFAAISVWLGLLSLRGGIRFVNYLQNELAQDREPFMPYVTVFMPLRGVDKDLNENLAACFAQDYPNFEIIFVTDSADDPALAAVDQARRSFKGTIGPAMQVLIAGAATNCGQKVHNLVTAIDYAHRDSAIFVFIDSDARPKTNWLRALVAPLRQAGIGATTGYRWFVRVGGLAAQLLSVWNAAIASALGANTGKNFCWGGATAIRRGAFNECRVMDYWRGAASDDFAMTRALHDAQLPIKFVPQCLTPSFEICTLRELIEFTTRQLKITRVYAPHLWKSVLSGSVIFVITFFGGLLLVITRAALGLSYATPLVLLLIIFAMGAMKSHLRLRAVATVIGEPRCSSAAATLAHVTLWPIASALYLYNGIAAAVSRRITWRGITYELKSPNETAIIGQRKTGRSQESEIS
ncbi:MAG TPA: glycosyltransferase family 2 protein [Pyrinomonadaceae bacterium]|nr:glycosyltransferase family 2 protein [Pyrinomonadaceae bacterium]